LALGLGLADGLGLGVALRLQLLGTRLQFLALRLQAGDGGGVEHETPARQLGGGGLEVGTKQTRVEHGSCLSKSGRRKKALTTGDTGKIPSPVGAASGRDTPFDLVIAA